MGTVAGLVGPGPVASVAEAGANAHRGVTLANGSAELCWECQQPIGTREYVRALVLKGHQLAGYVHVIACSERMAHKCATFDEYRALRARLVDLG